MQRANEGPFQLLGAVAGLRWVGDMHLVTWEWPWEWRGRAEGWHPPWLCLAVHTIVQSQNTICYKTDLQCAREAGSSAMLWVTVRVDPLCF